MRHRGLKALVSTAALAMVGLGAVPSARADDAAVVGTKLRIKQSLTTGKVSIKGKQKHVGVHFGPASTGAQLSGSIQIGYVDTPGNAATYSIPSPWASNDGRVAKYKNLIAPAGPSVAKKVRIVSGTSNNSATFDLRALGALSIASPPGNNGVVLTVTVNNAANGTVHRMCSRFSAVDGSVVQFKNTSTLRQLTLKNGVGVDCADACADGALNGTETDVDCGGNCPDCPDGDNCTSGSDCISGVCTGGICQVPTCTDGVTNATETDTDCGGPSCPDCPDGSDCQVNQDCTSSVCAAFICQAPTCTDGVNNGNETGVDCGGSCPGCPDGGPCTVGSDCDSGVCSAGICQAPTCVDGVKNGPETDTDCGGTCPACPDGSDCNVGADCQNLICVGNICFPANCGDGVKNGSETDIDCGGPTCGDCDTGETCSAGSDCTSGVCTAGLCAAPSCSDGVQNGAETDVDCGGPICGACVPGDTCNLPRDCNSGVCTSGVCQAPTCSDTVKNGTETGVDCGGGSCPDCPNGQGCSGNGDCVSNFCSGGICLPASCGDGIKNGSETDIDCGGGVCLGCDTGEDCVVGGDCNSGVCTGLICQAPTCNDGVKNQFEGDVDCGGGSCPLCNDGDTCNGNLDCLSQFCNASSHICQTPSCSDGIQNGKETDIDCGGDTASSPPGASWPNCPDCSYNQDCNVNPDCNTGACISGLCKCSTTNFDLDMSSNNGGSVDSAEWPGGTQSANNGSSSCAVTIQRPSGNIDVVGNLGDKFQVNSFVGFSSCFGSGGEDGDGCQVLSCPPAGIGSCEANRPSCSAALNGSGSARFNVTCNQ